MLWTTVISQYISMFPHDAACQILLKSGDISQNYSSRNSAIAD